MVETGTYREVTMGGRTSGTRHGNGMGWGGPPRGDVVAGKAGRPPGVKNGEGKLSVADLMADLQAREKIAKAWVAIIDNPNHPHHANMLVNGAKRMDGAEVQAIEAGAAGPLIIERVIIDNATNRYAEGVCAAADGGPV